MPFVPMWKRIATIVLGIALAVRSRVRWIRWAVPIAVAIGIVWVANAKLG